MSQEPDRPGPPPLTAAQAAAAEAFASATFAFGAAAALLHARVAATLELGVTDLNAVNLIARNGPLTAGEIGRCLGLASASVTALIDRLEAQQFVRRVRDADDGRRVRVEVRRDGMRRVGKALRAAGLDPGPAVHERDPATLLQLAALLEAITAKVHASVAG